MGERASRIAALLAGGSVEQGMVRLEGLLLSPGRAALVSLAEAAVGVGLLAVSARASLRLLGLPVPFTLQTFALTLLVVLLGPRAWRAVAAYLAAGLAGAPVFALGGGPGYLASPSFGYLLGFLLAALVAGRLSRPYSRRALLRGALLVLPLVYLPGALWLSGWLAAAGGMAWRGAVAEALWAGVLVFLPWDVLKAVAAAEASYHLLRLLYRAGQAGRRGA
ncbi:hypothetical protein CF15_07785 [Pyrodictium occultum]|uniref:Biotin transporter BioY n=1 Tax=Pyrodictium occultum TaxID=2309 RepID=A0A0V8RXB7_PYROC|nr:biotin transporter BioY [Pyrodictium occultum]KSW12602.1 hypothetical protein CF15_07785 [Pyrodictium occultum]